MIDHNLKSSSWRYVIQKALAVLKVGDRRKLKLIAIVQIGLGLLDLCALAIVGLLGSMAVKGISSPPQASKIDVFILRDLGPISFQKQIAMLGLIAALFLVGRTAITMILTRKTLYFLSIKSAELTANLAQRLLGRDLLTVQAKSKQETLFALTGGINMIFVGLLGAAIQILADSSLLLIMVGGLFVVDPLISFTSVVLFGAIAVTLYLSMHKKASDLGEARTELNIQTAEKIIEVLDNYREAVVRNRRSYYADKISNLRIDLASVEAEIAFMPSISKYIIEISVVIGALAICGLQFAMNDATHAIATLAVFMTAGSRIAPAILRLQQSAISANTALSSSTPSIRLLESLENEKAVSSFYSKEIERNHVGFIPKIEFEEVSFAYPNNNSGVENVSFKIEEGEFTAIVGASGAGKTTLVDLLLGVLIPSKGQITISSHSPEEAICNWPGAISYVPQDVSLIKGTIRENIALGYDVSYLSESTLENALVDASISEFVKQLKNGIDTKVGDGGQKLSGGQRQRLGIARSLITDPKLLVLDEATSALDGQTESDISNTLFSLRGNRTIVVIAHRLSSVRLADNVIYMDKGKILAQGTFEEVRAEVPNFDKQAKLMGL